jgi:cell division protein FtsI/penicillin-binding protein 2
MLSASANANGTYFLSDASSSTRTSGVTIQTALNGSSNQFFYFLAQNLSNLQGYSDSSYKLKTSLSDTEITDSGKLLAERLNKYFNINGVVNTNFGISDASIGSYFENWEYTDDTSILEQLTETDTVYEIDGKSYIKKEDNMWQEVVNVGTTDKPSYVSVQTYFSNKNTQAKKLGEVGHGIGTAQISPLYMAMSLGKCLTGTMYTPTLLCDEVSEEFNKQRIIAEPFEKDTTVDRLRECLSGVYSYNEGNDLPSGYTAFEKTGTSAQSKTDFYGDFGNTYYHLGELDSGTSSGYQTVWYSGAIEDGSHSYSIVVKSFATEKSSHALHEYFMDAVDSLQDFGYLD